ncbi:MAG: ABC transporter substrate-binding protein [Leptothrix sp. (in: b-proteobacteria)]
MHGLIRLLAWCLALCLGVGASLLAVRPAAAAEVQIRDQRGQLLRLAQPPQRIVSLLPSLTETVCALGACARLVATDRYSNWPASVAAVPKVGGLEDAQIERIVALKPDVVLAARSSRAIERLEALGQRVVVLEATNHAEVRDTLTTLATLLGQPEQGTQLWRGIEAQLQQAAARVPATVRGQKVYFEVDAAPYAAGAASFVGETLARLGMANIVPAALGPFPKLNPEFVVKAQPDLVMVVDRNAAEMIRRPGWASLRALQQGRLCGFPSARYDILVRPGPRLGEAALVLADCLAGLGAAGSAAGSGADRDGAARPSASGARR